MIRDKVELLDNIETAIKANLSAQITALNSRHSSILTAVPDANYYRFIEELPNKNPFIDLYITKVNTESIGGDTAQSVNVVVEIVLRRTNSSSETDYNRSLLYTEALRKAIEPEALELGARVTEMVPFAVNEMTGESLIVSGIQLSVNFA